MSPHNELKLLSGPAFGEADADSDRHFSTASRLMQYTVRGFDYRNLLYDAHLVAVGTHGRPVEAFRRIDDRREKEVLVPGAPIIVPQGAMHDSVVECDGSFVMAAVPEHTLRETSAMLGLGTSLDLVPTFPEQRDDALSALLLRAAEVTRTGDLAQSVELDVCLHRIAVHVVNRYSTAPRCRRGLNHGLTPSQLARVTDLVRARLADRLQIDDMAAVVSLSRHHFLRQFHRATGRTPAQFVIEHRLSHARARLAASDDPVSLIGAASGFTTEAHFSYTFRRRFGQSPSQFRQNARR